jgi:hypothetical protein
VVDRPKKDIARIFRERILIDQAIAAAAREAVLRHRQMGLPLVVWRDGRVVLSSPEELEQEGSADS